MSVLQVERAQDLASGEQYVDAATTVDTTDVTRLGAIKAKRLAARDDAAAKQRDLQAQLVDVTTQHDKLAAQAASDQAYLDEIGGVPVMGQSRLTATQIAGWFKSTGSDPSALPEGMSIDDLTKMYVAEGPAENVRGDIAFAQSILETGSFSEAPKNNYAGIGTCDSCSKGYGFPTPRDGVRAQVQLLRSYADPSSRAANLAYPPEAGVWGDDPVVAAGKYDNFFLKGKVPLWNQMGNGNWATATDYAPRIIGIYAKMLSWAADHPEVR
jgi:Mannosyl-glycoprotein endo-beta-N-acetylglucosaminidase